MGREEEKAIIIKKEKRLWYSFSYYVFLTKNFPKEALDKAIGTTVWIIMRDDQELRGTLKSFDDHINMVLENAVQLQTSSDSQTVNVGNILLNGTNIAMIARSIK